jgi:hypothetical protein
MIPRDFENCGIDFSSPLTRPSRIFDDKYGLVVFLALPRGTPSARYGYVSLKMVLIIRNSTLRRCSLPYMKSY